MNKRVIFLLPLVVAAFLVGSGTVSNVHASGYTGTGVVCVTASSTATNCPVSAPTIGPVTVGSSFTVGVFVNNSAPMGGFDVYVAVNPSYLNPTSASVGPLIAGATSTSICINGITVTGACTVGTVNGPGVVEVSTIETSGSNECGDVAPCSGMAFNITYQVVGTTPNTPISYPADGNGCSTSSVSSPANTCVLVADSTGTTLPENVQGATVTQSVTTGHSTSTAVSCTSPVKVATATTCTSTVTDTAASGATNPTGQVTFSTSGSGGFNPSSCTLSPVGANQATCSSSYTPQAYGSGTHDIGASYSGDTVHTGSTASAFALTVSKATPTLGTTVVVDSTGQPVNNAQGVLVGSSVHDTAILTGGYPVTGVSGTVTYTKYSNGNCASSGSTVNQVTVAGGNNVPNSASVILSPPYGNYSFQASYSGDGNNTAVTSGCELIVVTPRSTFTTIICTPSSVTVGGSASCLATVTDTLSSPTTPTGSVSFTTNSTGTFTVATCTLTAGAAGSASCSVSYSPTVSGHHLITGSYSTDASHGPSVTTYYLLVTGHTTTLGISCSPSSQTVGSSTTCTATVTDTSSSATTPTGTVSFSTNSTGTFSAATCTLTPGASGVSSCSITYTPSAVGSGAHLITASYSSDSTHATSSGSSTLTVTSAPAPVSGILGLSPIVFYSIIAAVIVIAALLAFLALRRRKPATQPQAMAPTSS